MFLILYPYLKDATSFLHCLMCSITLILSVSITTFSLLRRQIYKHNFVTLLLLWQSIFRGV